MADELLIDRNSDKAGIYRQILPQISALLDGEKNITANLGNTAAALKSAFNWLWVGFYLVEGEELVLGPFQGPIACTRIAKGKGVCGAAWTRLESIVVPDVEQFPGHIACSSMSRSELVVPLYCPNGKFAGVLDVDSSEYRAFDEVDCKALGQLADLLQHKVFAHV
jgi:GAF domain-containing protein